MDRRPVSSSSSSSGIGLLGALFLVLLTMKLLGKITWSWWWVTAPLWGGLALVLTIGLVILVVMGIAFATTKLWRR